MRVRRLGKLAMLNKSYKLSCNVQNVAGCHRVLQCVAVSVPGIWEAGDAYKGCALSCCMLQCVAVLNKGCTPLHISTHTAQHSATLHHTALYCTTHNHTWRYHAMWEPGDASSALHNKLRCVAVRGSVWLLCALCGNPGMHHTGQDKRSRVRKYGATCHE